LKLTPVSKHFEKENIRLILKLIFQAAEKMPSAILFIAVHSTMIKLDLELFKGTVSPD
jgi:hypothetical protein